MFQIILIAVELDGGNISFGVTLVATVRGLVFLVKNIERNTGIEHRVIGEGSEAVGSAFVKIRVGNKVYSGNGISTDIIGASIRAYVNALNKIVHEEQNANQ